MRLRAVLERSAQRATCALPTSARRAALAWPGTALVAARAALARSRDLDARGQLVKRGLIDIVEPGGGRGRSAMLLLRFAEGPPFDAPINAELFEAVLSYSRTSGPARLLLASIAALSDDGGQLDGVAAGELRVASCLARSTYRRVRAALITSGEIELVRGREGVGTRTAGASQSRGATVHRLRAAPSAMYRRRQRGCWCRPSRPIQPTSDRSPRPSRRTRDRAIAARSRTRGRRKERSGSDPFGGEGGSGSDGFSRKGRSGPDGFTG